MAGFLPYTSRNFFRRCQALKGGHHDRSEELARRERWRRVRPAVSARPVLVTLSQETPMPRTATIKRLRPTPEFPLDTHPEVSLDFTRVKQHLSKHGYKRPVLIVDLDIVRTKTRRFRAALARVRPHFAVKANPDPRVLKVLIQEGAGFEIASIAELDLLMSLNVPVAEIFYSNPMKSRAYLEYASAKGVEWFVVDSVEEIR